MLNEVGPTGPLRYKRVTIHSGVSLSKAAHGARKFSTCYLLGRILYVLIGAIERTL